MTRLVVGKESVHGRKVSFVHILGACRSQFFVDSRLGADFQAR